MSRTYPLILVLVGLLGGCARALGPVQSRWPALPEDRFMHVGTYLQVGGTGTADSDTGNETQGKALSRDAALTDARIRVRRYIRALPLGGGLSAGDRMQASPDLRHSIDRMIRFAGVVSTEWDESGTAVVLIRIDKKRINQLLGTNFK